jgi:hypothetical protein
MTSDPNTSLVRDVFAMLLSSPSSVISNLQETVQQWDGGLKHLIEKVDSLSRMLH